MRLIMSNHIDPQRLQRALVDACGALSPDDGYLCPRQVYRALLSGALDDAVVAEQWGAVGERRRLHRHDESRLAFDAAVVASVLPGPWFVPWEPWAA
jgi:hypothetical protein